MLDRNPNITLIRPSAFSLGCPMGDAVFTPVRKFIVTSYGGYSRHRWPFSGKESPQGGPGSACYLVAGTQTTHLHTPLFPRPLDLARPSSFAPSSSALAVHSRVPLWSCVWQPRIFRRVKRIKSPRWCVRNFSLTQTKGTSLSIGFAPARFTNQTAPYGILAAPGAGRSLGADGSRRCFHVAGRVHWAQMSSPRR